MDFLLPEFKKIILLLLKHDVKFMLIGGYAVIYYGYERTTGDMDIWLQPDNDNRDKLCKALTEFGINPDDILQISQSDFSQIQFFFFGKKPRRIDFLTKINLVNFDEAFTKANHFPLADQMVPIIHYQHLILSKISNSRPQDKADVDELQKIMKHKKSKS